MCVTNYASLPLNSESGSGDPQKIQTCLDTYCTSEIYSTNYWNIRYCAFESLITKTDNYRFTYSITTKSHIEALYSDVAICESNLNMSLDGDGKTDYLCFLECNYLPVRTFNDTVKKNCGNSDP